MSYEQLLIDFGVRYQTEGHKHCRPGWANMPCPFCTGNPGLHLGMELQTGRFYCWRCGGKNPVKAISSVAGINEHDARAVLQKYRHIKTRPAKQDHRIKFHPLKHPSGTGPLRQQHKRYLENRRFDPAYLEQEWELLGTGPVSSLDDIDYKHRVLAPIYWNSKEVTFQTRDITNKSQVKYMACPKNREEIHHKNILYGKQSAWGDVGICVEGITDVWRLGPKAFATFGIEFKLEQVMQIYKANFKRVVIIFDDDPQAVKQAKKLATKIKGFGISVGIETIKGDPGDMDQDDANHLVKEVLR